MKIKFWTEYDFEFHVIVEKFKKAIRAVKFRSKRKKVTKRNAVKRK